MKPKKQVLHYCFAKAKEFIKLGDRDKAYEAKDTIEDVRVELWLERFWMFLENKGLLL